MGLNRSPLLGASRLMGNSNLAFVFPGQGSQSKGMLAELAEKYPGVKDTFEAASRVLGYDLWALVQEDAEDKLSRTQFTQPALLTASIATWNTWHELGGETPSILAGHSLGEYSALVSAGVLQFEDAVGLVAERGRLMQEAVPDGEGAMAAILGLEDEQVINLCNEVAGEGTVSAANFNSPGQVVIAGTSIAVEKVVDSASSAGARKAMLLAVSVPSHCSLMLDAADAFSEVLDKVEFSNGNIPVVQNVDATARTDASEIKKALVEQLHQSVHWWKSVKSLQADGITHIVECGPGKILSGLIKRIDRSLLVQPVFDPESLEKALGEC